MYSKFQLFLEAQHHRICLYDFYHLSNLLLLYLTLFSYLLLNFALISYLLQYAAMVSLLLYLALVSCIPKISYTGKVTFTHLYLVLVSFLLLYLALVFLPTPIPFTGLFLTPTPCVGLLSTPINTLQWSISWVWWGESRLKKIVFVYIDICYSPTSPLSKMW